MVEKGPKPQGAFKNPEAILDVFLKIEHTTYNSQLDPDLMKSWAFDVARVFRLRASAHLGGKVARRGIPTMFGIVVK